ncbi:MAG: hypothetical protein KAH03_00690 [Cocleimonas sp.]|nr:hypothetical protein [Cocleimonas sp.]
MKQNNLKERWFALFNHSKMSSVELLFNSLVKNYNESHRYYHTLSHIHLCLEEYDEIKEDLNDSFSVEIALWFHDITYLPKENDNEEKSSIYAKNSLSKVDAERKLIKKVCNLIQSTKHPSCPKTLDEKYIVDIDLSIMGAPSEIYTRYSNQIRKEYSHVPDFLYSCGRKKFLNTLLTLKYIYHTEHFKNKYELTARENIRNEIHRIE